MTQDEAFHFLKTGQNVFLSGVPGSGKTFLLKKYIAYLRARNVSFGVVAPTGIAASHIEGVSIHSFFGLGIKNVLNQYELESILEKKYLWDRFRKLKVLIIDEVSMVSPDLFETMDVLLRQFKFSTLPFGGIQLVLSGDFFQLPPVQKEKRNIRFIFQTPLWNKLNLSFCYLTQSFRQKDKRFFELLQAIRGKNLKDEHFKLLKLRENKKRPGAEITRLYTHNIDVERVNKEYIENLPGAPYFFDAKKRGKRDLVQKLFQNNLLSEKLILKRNALVLFIKNNEKKGYVNGTLGKIINFSSSFPVVRTFTGKEILVKPEVWEIKDEEGILLGKIEQIPLKLARAITIHKSQGMTLDAAEIDLSKVFERGQGYVALSRLSSLNGLFLLGFHRYALEVNDLAFSFYENVKNESKKNAASLFYLSQDEKEELYKKFID